MKFLVLHGWGSSASHLKLLKSRLEGIGTVYVPDLPGFGSNKTICNNWYLDDYCKWVINYVKKQDIKDFVIIGYSFGGRIILELLGDKKYHNFSKYIKKAILISGAGVAVYPMGYMVKKKLFVFGAKIVKPVRKLVPKKLYKVAYRLLGSDYAKAKESGLKQTFINIINEDLSPLLKNIKKPMLLVYGDKDKDTPLIQGRYIKEHVKHSRLHIVHGGTHYMIYNAKYLDNIVQIIKQFIGKLK